MDRLAILGGNKIRTQPFPMERPQITQDDIHGVVSTLQERQLSIFSSSKIHEFELAFANYVGTNEAIALTSGTAALHAVLTAIDIRPEDEVIVPVYTHMSTINPVLMLGASPIFVDIDSETFNLDIAQVEKKISPRTKAIILVDIFGNPAPRKKLLEIAAAHNLYLIEDCAQSLGAKIHGQSVGSFAIGCHSFGEIKNITSAEGGMVTTNNSEIARRVRIIRHEGEIWKESKLSTIGTSPNLLIEMIHGIDYELVGHNYRMSALQAALGMSQLSRIEDINGERIYAGTFYTKALENIPFLQFQSIETDAKSVYNRFLLLLRSNLKISRDAFLAALISEGIPAGVYYPTPLNRAQIFLDYFRHRNKYLPGDNKTLTSDESNNNFFPQAEQICERQILLPCYPGLKIEDLETVVAALDKIIHALLDPSVANDVEDKAKNITAEYFGQFFTIKG